MNELWFVMFCQCYVTVTMFCNNVSVLCLHVIVTDYVLIGEIACRPNKHPLLLLLLFKYLGATLTENGDMDAEMSHTIQSEWKKLEERVLGVLCGRRLSLSVKGKWSPIQDGCKTINYVRCRDMHSEETTRRSWMW